MTTRFVCLANSFKEGGRCLAGIELDSYNNPIFANSHPKWVRPICNTLHGEVHTHLVSHIKTLDIIEIETTMYPQVINYQSENVFFNENCIDIIDRFDNNRLNSLCDNRDLIFGNRGKAVCEEKICNMRYSLMFIKINQFEVIEKSYNDSPNRSKTRLVFLYKDNKYDLPITDPVFLHRYQLNPDYLTDQSQLFVSLSLSVEWLGWYYKLIASILH